MQTISILPDIRQAKRNLSALQQKQIPFAIAGAVNDLAFQVMRAENAAIAKLFKHPRPFTKSAAQVEQKARKGTPTAIVSIRANRGYLAPYEDGGVHVLPGKALLNPKDIPLDAYGQISQNTLKLLKGRSDVFVGTVRGVTGFWQRMPLPPATAKRALPAGIVRQQLKLLIRFGSALPVKQHLDFRKRATMVVRENAAGALQRAIMKALATAR